MSITNLTPRSCSVTLTYTLPAHNEKCDIVSGKLAYTMLVRKSVEVTLSTDKSEWDALVDAGSVIILKTSGEMPEPTPNFGSGKGRQTRKYVSHTYTVNTRFTALKENLPMLQNLNHSEDEWSIIMVTASLHGFAPFDKDLNWICPSWECHPQIPAGDTEEVEGVINGEWTTNQQPHFVDLPSTLFTSLLSYA